MKAWMYILECTDGSYYTGSTKNLDLRLSQHQNGEGANYTRKRLPVKLIYFEEFNRIDEAFYREKQVQGWSRKKKEALIKGLAHELKKLAECKNDTHFSYNTAGFDTAGFDTAGFDTAGFDSAGFDSAGFDSAQPA
jgi:predicted GIY-YIG superfamily endonuclease